MPNPIRPIVRAAFKVDELVDQFENIDVPDGVLVTGDIAEVNERFDDEYLVNEAENRLLLVKDQLECITPNHAVDWKILNRDQKQLTQFIRKFSK